MDKPHIDKLFDAVRKFMINTSNAGYNVSSWQKAYDVFKQDCDALGIADHFNWGPQE